MTKILLVVVGPTAIGKTRIAIQLAKHYNCDIVSADSRQFYKEMRIGTAVPSKEELEAATHHFIQHRSIHEPTYSVGDYEKEAIQLLTSLYQTSDKAILVGGSGLYLKAVTKGLDYFPEVNPEVKKELSETVKKKGIVYLQKLLKVEDPIYSEKVDLNNVQRVQRALEVTLSSGKPYSSFITGDKKQRDFTPVYIGLTADRPVIYDRINRRVYQMIKEGLFEEAKKLLPFSKLNALNTVGYKESFKLIKKEWDIPFATSEIQKNTRRFAKRQETWFRKNKEIKWFDYDAPVTDVIAYIDTLL